MIEQDLYSALLTVCERVSPIFMPQDVVMPAIVYQVVYDGLGQCLSGAVYAKTTRLQVDVYSDTYEEAKSLKEQVISKVIDLKASDIASQDLYDQEAQLFRQLIDFTIKE